MAPNKQSLQLCLEEALMAPLPGVIRNGTSQSD